jgi:hypothetical protein
MQPRYANEVGNAEKGGRGTVFAMNVEIEDSKFERSTGRSRLRRPGTGFYQSLFSPRLS